MEQFLQSLSGAGVVGTILAYYLYKLEPRLKSMEDTLARQGKIDLLRLIASPHVAPELKAEAESMVREINAFQEGTKSK